MYGLGVDAHKALVHELGWWPLELIPELPTIVDGLWIHSPNGGATSSAPGLHGVITIPDPSLVALIGAAGAGKSRFAARQFEPGEVLSSDAYRAMITGDEADQSATRAAFARLHHDLVRRLGARRLVVVDATNVEPAARRALLERAGAADVPAVAIVLDLPAAVILARNAGRVGRVVDPRVVQRHLARLHATPGPLDAALRREGFSQVVLIRDSVELDGLSVVRLRP